MRLRCKSSAVPPILESQATRWELQGLQGIEMPSRFTLSWHGTLHAERGGGGSHVKGQLEMSISLALPPVLDLVPKDILRAMIESVLKRFLQNMKHKADASLVSDFEKYRREQLMKHGRASQHPEPVPELDGDS
ncbi:uncharacterized protein [Elaeis guineensis]|uniref:Uncharacterized protein LOC105041946 n=1 Tax=Elaeis guineensis var. tenera TaxID=51953 RepID=A0A8N4ICU5_ELAGV|nr:uncharacterized protein LOC105041946 [Elaeis guineensis]